MAVRIVWSRKARKDLNDVGSYIRRDNPAAARKVLCSIDEKVDSLALFPEMGRVVLGNLSVSVREVICRPYRIIYFHERDQNLILVVRIWHAARGEPLL